MESVWKERKDEGRLDRKLRGVRLLGSLEFCLVAIRFYLFGTPDFEGRRDVLVSWIWTKQQEIQ